MKQLLVLVIGALVPLVVSASNYDLFLSVKYGRGNDRSFVTLKCTPANTTNGSLINSIEFFQRRPGEGKEAKEFSDIQNATHTKMDIWLITDWSITFRLITTGAKLYEK